MSAESRAVRSRVSRSSAVLVVILLAVPAAAAGARFDADSAHAKAHALTPYVLRADAGPLWREFDSGMRAALKDSASLAATLRSMQAQMGTLDSVLSDTVTASVPGTFVHRALCRFAKFPGPLELIFAFDADGRVSGLLARPPAGEKRTEYASPRLDYRTRTRLHLPVRGEWTVFWGGRTLAQNYHAFTRDQRFAMDLLIVREGRTHRGDGKALADYYCYGMPVLAPAAGTVVWEQDSLPDNPPGRMDPAHATGNSLVIDHGDGEFSVLAHLQPGSLRFKVGDRVTAGDEVGLCGNSGNTSEPHVHYHLQDGPRLFDAEGLPVQFAAVIVNGKRLEHAEIERGQSVRRAE